MNWIAKLGQAVIDFFAARLGNMGQALQIAGVGMLGIFVVMGIVIVSVLLLNKLCSRK